MIGPMIFWTLMCGWLVIAASLRLLEWQDQPKQLSPIAYSPGYEPIHYADTAPRLLKVLTGSWPIPFGIIIAGILFHFLRARRGQPLQEIG